MAASDGTGERRGVQAEFDAAVNGNDRERYVLRLYVAGMSPRSRAAIDNLRAICEQYLAGRCELDVIDVYQRPEQARAAQLVAAPTLIKELPLPVRRLLGDLSDTDKVLAGLDLKR
jgi:circadian clock protein KaiB